MLVKKVHESKQNEFAHVEHSCSTVDWIFFYIALAILRDLIEIIRNLTSTFEIFMLCLPVKSFLCCYPSLCEFGWILKNKLILEQT